MSGCFPANSDLASHNQKSNKMKRSSITTLNTLNNFLKKETENHEQNSPTRLRSITANI